VAHADPGTQLLAGGGEAAARGCDPQQVQRLLEGPDGMRGRRMLRTGCGWRRSWRILWGGSAIGRHAIRAAEVARRGLDWISNRCPSFARAG